MSFDSIAATGVSTIGTLATVGIVAGVANNTVRTLNRTVPRGTSKRVYSPRRVMAHRSIYQKTSRKKGYSVFG